jgi:hypothetical protein
MVAGTPSSCRRPCVRVPIGKGGDCARDRQAGIRTNAHWVASPSRRARPHRICNRASKLGESTRDLGYVRVDRSGRRSGRHHNWLSRCGVWPFGCPTPWRGTVVRALLEAREETEWGTERRSVTLASLSRAAFCLSHLVGACLLRGFVLRVVSPAVATFVRRPLPTTTATLAGSRCATGNRVTVSGQSHDLDDEVTCLATVGGGC